MQRIKETRQGGGFNRLTATRVYEIANDAPVPAGAEVIAEDQTEANPIHDWAADVPSWVTEDGEEPK